MILTLLILVITATSFTASAAMNPLTMGLLILFMSLLLAVTFAMSMSSWVAFLIFLIYIGGMLVMFSYFVAITPNQNLSMPLIFSMLFASMFALILVSFSTLMHPPIHMEYVALTNIMYEVYNIHILIILAMILLFTMLVVVKISIHGKGPLRPYFKYV